MHLGQRCNEGNVLHTGDVSTCGVSYSALPVTLVLRGRHTVRFSRTKIIANQSIVRVAGDTRVSETGRSYDIEFRTCSKLLPMISDEWRASVQILGPLGGPQTPCSNDWCTLHSMAPLLVTRLRSGSLLCTHFIIAITSLPPTHPSEVRFEPGRDCPVASPSQCSNPLGHRTQMLSLVLNCKL